MDFDVDTKTLHVALSSKFTPPVLAPGPVCSLNGSPQSWRAPLMAPSVLRGGIWKIWRLWAFQGEISCDRAPLTLRGWTHRDSGRWTWHRGGLDISVSGCPCFKLTAVSCVSTGVSWGPGRRLDVVVTMFTSGWGARALAPCGLVLLICWSVCLSQQQQQPRIKPADCSRKEHPVVSYQGEGFTVQ